MKILLCGARDVIDILPQFDEAMEDMSFESNNFINGTIGATNGNTWTENSKEAVEIANLVVFVLIHDAGEITWGTEYTTAVDSGKPYVLLCEKKLADHYNNVVPDKTIKVLKNNRFNKAAKILDRLIYDGRTIVEFNSSEANFKKKLITQINSELVRATNQLQKYNKRKTILARIENRNYKELFKEKVSDEYLQHFKNILFDQFDKKERRKRVLYYFTIHKGLTDDELMELFEDPEQGVSRMAIDILPLLVTSANDKEKLVKAVTSIVRDTDDTGLVRRGISSIFEVDFKIGLKYIFDIFPATDIGTPKRIVAWLNEHEKDLIPYLKDVKIKNKLKELANLCEEYGSKTGSLKKLVESLRKVIKLH